ncbi:MAG: hypothetical protein N2593_04180 [Patescibacteria group bacterium]|nr:hypothetical protein [Patescibacteria group bacterium]
MNTKIKNFILFLLFIIVASILYQLGKQTNNLKNKYYKEKKEALNCPYILKGEQYRKYKNTEEFTEIVGKPEIIENPKVIKMNEVFNFFEFDKQLYKLPNDKGWSERKFDVDEDGKEERIISANIAMNHTPHIALILKNNQIIFKMEGPNVWIEKSYQGKGFFLQRTIDWNTGEREILRYIPKDGGFLPIWKQKLCRVYFE